MGLLKLGFQIYAFADIFENAVKEFYPTVFVFHSDCRNRTGERRSVFSLKLQHFVSNRSFLHYFFIKFLSVVRVLI